MWIRRQTKWPWRSSRKRKTRKFFMMRSRSTWIKRPCLREVGLDQRFDVVGFHVRQKVVLGHHSHVRSNLTFFLTTGFRDADLVLEIILLHIFLQPIQNLL